MKISEGRIQETTKCNTPHRQSMVEHQSALLLQKIIQITGERLTSFGAHDHGNRGQF